jgi:hypothetical protein
LGNWSPYKRGRGKDRKKKFEDKMTEKFPNSMKIIKPQRVAAC